MPIPIIERFLSPFISLSMSIPPTFLLANTRSLGHFKPKEPSVTKFLRASMHKIPVIRLNGASLSSFNVAIVR